VEKRRCQVPFLLSNAPKKVLDTFVFPTPLFFPTDLDQDRAHNRANELNSFATSTGTDWVDPAHDRAGNMTTIPQPKDLANGFAATYDAWNRLVEVKNQSGTTVTTNEYDGLNRRTVRDETGGSGALRRFYYSSSWQVVEERIDLATDADRQFVWGARYVDDLVLRDDFSGCVVASSLSGPEPAGAESFWDALAEGSSSSSSSSSSGSDSCRHYYLQDANFNVVAVADDAGTVIERYHYTPYGEVTILVRPEADVDGDWDVDGFDFLAIQRGGTGVSFATWSAQFGLNGKIVAESTVDNEFLFTGRRRDPETGLQLNRNRFYHQQLGRWVSRDPIGFEGGWNLYGAYFVTGGVDPTGEVTLLTAKWSMVWKGVFEPTQRQIFFEWARLERAVGLQWVRVLPLCPNEIMECPKDSGKWQAKNRLSGNWKKLSSVLWQNPVPPHPLEKRLHPDTNHPGRNFTWSLRSVVISNHTNQCTYDQKGKLFRSQPASGTVDFRPAPSYGHWVHDVTPILSANRLDGGGGELNVVVGVNSIKRVPGPAMKKYYEVRPLWAFPE